MRVPEIGLGMNMSWQSVPRMLHLMGPARTKQAVISGRPAHLGRRGLRMAAGGGDGLNPARRSTPRWRSPPRSLPSHRCRSP